MSLRACFDTLCPSVYPQFMRALLTRSIARRLKSCAVVVPLVAAAAFLDAGHAQAVIVWDWSFNSPGGFGGSGTFTTEGDTPEANVSYALTGVTGTVAGKTITSFTPTSFQWSGAATNKILIAGDMSTGIQFGVDDGGSGSIYRVASGLGEPDDAYLYGPEFTYGFSGVVTSNSLVPKAGPGPDPEPVPGPLPLMGAAAAFGWSRRMHRRLKRGADAS